MIATLEKIENLAKRRGFFYRASEIYGGMSGFYEYGHIGTRMKRKFENIWRKYFLSLNRNFHEIEAADIMAKNTFVASGHIKNFVDPVVVCKKCGYVERADTLIENILHESFEGKSPEELTKIIKEHKIKCPKCGGDLSEVSYFNMMFPVNVGIFNVTESYLRPETAQGVYINFIREFNLTRKKLPLGLAIVGKSFRNEISPRQLTLRQREFTQAELQIFFDPSEIDKCDRWDDVKDYELIIKPSEKNITKMKCSDVEKKLGLPKFYIYYMAKVQQFYLDILKIPEDKFRMRQLSEEEKAFYNKYHWDVELYLNSLGKFKEVSGIHYRTDHDLIGHQKVSGVSQEVFYNGRKFVPHVLELSFGVDRILFSFLDIGYAENKDRFYLKLPPIIAPFTIAVFPLVKKLSSKAEEVYESLKNDFDVFYDESGSIGRRYARQDEIGTPFCITIDFQTIEDNTVTIRFRNTTEQKRIKMDEIKNFVNKNI